jgi:hypothetical protein
VIDPLPFAPLHRYTVTFFAVDVCSEVRTDEKLDEEKLKRFIAEVGK